MCTAISLQKLRNLAEGQLTLAIGEPRQWEDDLNADEDGDDVEAPHDAGVVVVSSSPYSSLLHSPLIIVSAMVTFLTGVSTQWYQPSLEPFVRGQFGLTSFQVRIVL